jgi:hypothetical protein
MSTPGYDPDEEERVGIITGGASGKHKRSFVSKINWK